MEMVARAKAEVVVLHAAYVPVLYDPGYAGGTPLAYDISFLNRIEEDTKRGYEKMKNESGVRGVSVSLDIVHDNLISAIQHHVDRKQTDLIIMGTSGASGIREVFIGSNTEKIVRFAQAPVLAVHKAPPVSSIKKILLPTTLRLDQTDFMNKVKELQEFFGATLHVLLVNTASHFRTDKDAVAALEEFAKHYHLKNHTLHFKSYDNEEDGIIDFTYKEGIDLIAMATHARKGLARLFTGSITEDVVNHISAPVWTYNKI
ncbi:universal stress protein family [Fulvivirga imtechensis AK7]|uniref:Universal stress protein family n=2 Tax=Fulvivirga TaxID=396811 RepID=L8JSU8_9BACT|nr:universal stress protein family [Fulvivirga imtechensis AK7]